MSAREVISLDGVWRFSLGGDAPRRVRVPAAWEAHSRDKGCEGPAVYEREIDIPEAWLARGRVLLECDGVSFATRVSINGATVGGHTGMWSRFTVDLTRHARAGRNALRLEVRKPGASHPPRASLAGFLPDVATTFGGVWQSACLVHAVGPQAGPRRARGPLWRARGGLILRDGQPAHLRGVLDWGWNARRIAPTRSASEVRAQIRKARALGFNLVKWCLFVPDEVTLATFDAEGMPAWLELPLWQPEVTPEFANFALRECAAILRRVSRFGCIAVVSAGCELDRAVDADFLAALARLARRHLPRALFIDNSGSAEAYGGAVTGLGDFHDYHFYADPHFLDPLMDHFDRAHRARKPWLFGEFCDADTGRDLDALLEPADSGASPVDLRPTRDGWWLRDDLPTPKPELLRMREGVGDPAVRATSQELLQTARQQATAVRKFVLERVRLRHASGGYVVSGWQDTPITTSGVVDDRGALKFSPREWRQFNADRVLLIDRPPARSWTHGGDRPDPPDLFTVWDDAPLSAELVLANAGPAVPAGTLDWEWAIEGRRIQRGGADAAGSAAGAHGRLATLALPASPSDAVSGARLRATFRPAGDRPVANAWDFYCVPGRARVLEALAAQGWHSRLDGELLERVAGGGQAVLWLQDDATCTRRMPFWREAVHVFQPHPIWGGLPARAHADLRWFGVATDLALDPARLDGMLAATGHSAQVTPLWRRWDARRLEWHAYLAEARIGRGRLFISTLRFAGGHGAQPASFARNPLGAWLLAALLGGSATV